MKIEDKNCNRFCSESEIYTSLLPLDNAVVLELGCGKAQHTREIAEKSGASSVVAMEVDEIQHELNLKITDLPKVVFKRGGAEAIDYPDNSFDVVFMFKSLHHVPVDLMPKAILEIRRVLKPDGLAYISEPVYAGEFNDILRIFHDEEQVRIAAFNACRQAVDQGILSLVGEYFFYTPMRFEGFEEFEKNVLGVTHSHFEMNDAIFQTVKQKFMQRVSDGVAQFQVPIRVDLLRKS